MITLLMDNKMAVRELCARFGVERLEVFGSAATGQFNAETSDIDFLLQFLPCAPGEHYDRYFGLLEALEELFGRRVDLVEIGTSKNPYFIRRMEESRVPLYAA